MIRNTQAYAATPRRTWIRYLPRSCRASNTIQIRTWYNGYSWAGQAAYNPFDDIALQRPCVYLGIQGRRAGPEGRALQQIKDRGYADKHRGSGEPIYLIGVEFSRKERTVVGFEGERLAERQCQAQLKRETTDARPSAFRHD